MDKQDHNRVNSIKVGSTTAISPKSGVAQPSDDILVEIRDDYREAKKQLKRYNKFIDKHPLATISILLLLSLVVLPTVAYFQLMNNGIMAYVSLGLIVVCLILAFVCGGRISSANKIVHKMKEFREEAAQYQRAAALGLGEKNISRDELGLFQESLKEDSFVTQQNETTKESGGLILLGWIAIILRFFTSWGAISDISIIASIAALIISIILVASRNPTNKRNGKVILVIWIVIVSIVFIVAFNNAQQAQQQTQQTQNALTCMASARDTYDPTVPNAAETLTAETQACSNGQ
jgi:uncharacterized membrane protein